MMICPYCANDKTRVEATIKGLVTERFRKCPKCERTFCTVENIKPRDRELEEYIKIVDESEKIDKNFKAYLNS